MAIVSAWTSNMPTNQRPTGAVIPAVTLPAVATNRDDFTIDLTPDATYDNAVEATAFAAIGAAVKTEWDTNHDTAIHGLDAAANIHARIVIEKIERRFDTFEYGDYKNQYKVAVGIFRCTGYVEWAVDA